MVDPLTILQDESVYACCGGDRSVGAHAIECQGCTEAPELSPWGFTLGWTLASLAVVITILLFLKFLHVI